MLLTVFGSLLKNVHSHHDWRAADLRGTSTGCRTGPPEELKKKTICGQYRSPQRKQNWQLMATKLKSKADPTVCREIRKMCGAPTHTNNARHWK
ncbi:hypothetical protein BaRGS_00029091 [Batillaria attramentaria]|uniref:Uncharacterized protein n=1 Tax=Batillaria attramentaria TaxID=370345 RepID=A0ABD0JYC7_9CAEN